MFYTYVLYSPGKDRFYIGFTADLIKALDFKNRYRSREIENESPWELTYFQSFSTRAEAVLKRKEIKRDKSPDYLKKGCCCSGRM